MDIKRKVFQIFIDRTKVPNEMLLILHETPGASFSLIPGDQLGAGSKVERIKVGDYTWLGISKEVKKWNVQKKENACKVYKPSDSQAKCYIRKVMLKDYYNAGNIMNCTDGSKNVTVRACMIPQNMDVLKLAEIYTNESFPECSTKEEYGCWLSHLETLSDVRDSECPRPCEEIVIKTTKRSTPLEVEINPLLNLSIIVMKYEDNQMDVLEEYLIFDFNAIVVAVGGSLGLFLGFSFFQCGSLIMTGLHGPLSKLCKRQVYTA